MAAQTKSCAKMKPLERSLKLILAFCPLLLAPLLSACDWASAQGIAQSFPSNNPSASEKDQAKSKEMANQLPMELRGQAMQSGVIIGKTIPNAKIDAAGIETLSDEFGVFIVGFDRDAPPIATITVRADDGRTVSRELNIAPRQYKITEVNGLPPATINPPPEAMERIQRDSALKQQAFSSRASEVRGFEEVFSWPLQNVRVTSPWGAQRKLNGEGLRPHYGIDLGGAIGTPIFAPATGRVILAQTGMHYEGGMTAIDHGQGLISVYLHQSKIDVSVGQIVNKGDKIGEIGKEGRATGPHLCWRMRWRGRQIDPSNLIEPKPIL